MVKQKTILKYLYKNNCKTEFCDIKHIVANWTLAEIVNTLSTLRKSDKIEISQDSNYAGIGSRPLGILQTLDNSIIKVSLKDEGEKYYRENYSNKSWTMTKDIIALSGTICTIIFSVITCNDKQEIKELKKDNQLLKDSLSSFFSSLTTTKTVTIDVPNRHEDTSMKHQKILDGTKNTRK